MNDSKPTVGVGACLLGKPVRYNGNSKRRNMHLDHMQQYLTMKTYCPEVAIGLGVPRKPVRLVGESQQLRLTDSDTQSEDYTDSALQYAAAVVRDTPALAGYVLVKGSPSCGYERVKRYNEKGNAVASDVPGIFAGELARLDPLLPMEEDGRLHDASLRENFLARVYAYHDWKQLQQVGITLSGLIAFWSRYKYLAMSRQPGATAAIGRILANPKGRPLRDTAGEFIAALMHTLARKGNRKTHCNVLQHLMGYLKRDLQGNEKSELDQTITNYRLGIVPLIVPLTLLRHHFNRHRHDYIEQQVFMQPYPEQLGLRNAI